MGPPLTRKSMSINYHTQPHTSSKLRGQVTAHHAISFDNTYQAPKAVMIVLPLTRQSLLQRRLKCLVSTIVVFS